MKDEILALRKEICELKDVFYGHIKSSPMLDRVNYEKTLSKVLEDALRKHTRDEQVLNELRMIRYGMIGGIGLAILVVTLLLWLAE